VSRPRLLLVPEFSEVEWHPIRGRLEEWADVASYDPPGVGDEPPAETFDRAAIVRRGPRAPLNAAVYEAVAELVATDHEQFLRHGMVQATGGSVDEEQAERVIERFPPDLIQRGFEILTRDDVDLRPLLEQLDCPLLFAKHEGCLGSTDEGFEDAAAAFPGARIVSVSDAPLTSDIFAQALREFCEEAGPRP
jgi:hypothetical protein